MSEYDIFISYRREGGVAEADRIASRLRNRGYRVFFDGDSIGSEDFETKIAVSIRASTDVLVLLTPGALDRCVTNPANDYVGREIAYAMQLGKNVVPVMAEGFVFPPMLPRVLEPFTKINAGDSVDFSKPQAIEQMLEFKISKGYFKSTPRAAKSEKPAASGGKRGGWLGAAALVVAGVFGFAVYEMRSADDGAPEKPKIERTGTSSKGTTGTDAGTKPAQTGTTNAQSKPTPPAPMAPSKPAILPDDFTSFENAALESFAKSKCFGDHEKLRDMENKTIEIKLKIRQAQEAGNSEAEARETKRLEAYRAEAGKIRKAIKNSFFGVNEKPAAHTVVRGERLATIAKKLGCTKAALVEANPGVSDATLKVGQTLKVPESVRGASAPRDEDDDVFIPGEKTTYEVGSGDYSAAAIAAKLGCTEAALRAANPDVNFSGLSRGEVLNIPKGGSR
ncbi:MAG: LysM peptidoglycan-binding domain-containing protein [Candidatus Spyradosoma sp.]